MKGPLARREGDGEGGKRMERGCRGIEGGEEEIEMKGIEKGWEKGGGGKQRGREASQWLETQGRHKADE